MVMKSLYKISMIITIITKNEGWVYIEILICLYYGKFAIQMFIVTI